MANQLSGLRNLPQHKWGFRIAIAAATIGIIYGYDLGAIAGALLFITKDFDLSTKQTEWVATIVVVGSIVGALTGRGSPTRSGASRRWCSWRSRTPASRC